MNLKNITREELPPYTEEQWMYMTGNKCSLILELDEPKDSPNWVNAKLITDSGIKRIVFLCANNGSLISTLFIEEAIGGIADRNKMCHVQRVGLAYNVSCIVDVHPYVKGWYTTFVNYAMPTPLEEYLNDLPYGVDPREINSELLTKKEMVTLLPLPDLRGLTDRGAPSVNGSDIDLAFFMQCIMSVFRDFSDVKCENVVFADNTKMSRKPTFTVLGKWSFSMRAFENVSSIYSRKGFTYAYDDEHSQYFVVVCMGKKMLTGYCRHIDGIKPSYVPDMLDEDDAYEFCMSLCYDTTPRIIERNIGNVYYNSLADWHKYYADNLYKK